jgi:hypothetical protein
VKNKQGAPEITILLYLSIMVFGTKMSVRRPDSPRSGQPAPVGRTVRACAVQIRVSSFVLRLLAIFAELARKSVV